MRAGPARYGHRTGQPAAARVLAGQSRVGQADEVGRVDLAADQDEPARRRRRRAGPAQLIDHGRRHLANIAGALGQVGVGQRGEHGSLGLGGRSDGGNTVGPGPYRVDGRPGQGGVRGDQRADVDDAGLEVLAALAEPGRERGPLPRDRGERRPHLVLARAHMVLACLAGRVTEVDLPSAGAL